MSIKIEDVEVKIGRFLRGGVLFAGAVIALGWLLNFSWSEDIFTKYRTYDPIPLQNFVQYYYNQGEWGYVLSYLGLGILISLPLLRVLLTGLLFLRTGERVLAAIAALVLVGLIVSFSLGITH